MHSIDALARAMDAGRTRRTILPVLGGLLAATYVEARPGEAKKKKKVTLCFNGATIKASRKKQKKLLKQGATPGACQAPPPPPPPLPVCTPNCPGIVCGVDDGCGGVCSCGQNAFCDGGDCQSCDVTNAAGLQAALDQGGAFVVCPGRYVGNFHMDGVQVTLIGAGDGDDPETSTILDANNSGRVVNITVATAIFQRLRITGGNSAEGGGIRANGNLTLFDCTVEGNVSGDSGGGISNFNDVTLNGCTIAGNHASSNGGGIRNAGGSSTVDLNNCILAGNTANGSGGGFFNLDGAMKFSGGRITGNAAAAAGIGVNENGTVGISPDTTVSGNNPNICAGC